MNILQKNYSVNAFSGNFTEIFYPRSYGSKNMDFSIKNRENPTGKCEIHDLIYGFFRNKKKPESLRDIWLRRRVMRRNY
jgi:hypothetical protein